MMHKLAVDTMACSERLKAAKGTFARLGVDSKCTKPYREFNRVVYRREMERQGIQEFAFSSSCENRHDSNEARMKSW